ncbi:hypothetical protein DM558_06185 [Entomomonas moraniae]|uniref:Lipoprotein n=1 Tax=Entomomonas moraniae TaxID=2213226 RepID=A0A3Q9JLD5_9GAMM|nr:hypothetical protein [Entomomonas moraniae]AZS50388.1 hypothetical protein DM558_06185 [Entomomonas moraniae]
MKKIILMGLSVLLLAGCDGKKDYPIDEVFTKDSAFGVNANTTLDELKKKVELKEVKPNMYASNSAPKPYNYLNSYTYVFENDKICIVLGARKGDVKEKAEFVGEYDKLKNAINDIIYKAKPSKLQDIETRWTTENPFSTVRLGVYEKNNDVYFNYHVRYSYGCTN